MFHSRTLDNRINKLHERALRVTHTDETSTFEELLHIDGALPIHERNLQKTCHSHVQSKKQYMSQKGP